MPDTRVCDESLVNHMGSLVGRTTSHHALCDGAVCVVCGMRACGSLVACSTSHSPVIDMVWVSVEGRFDPGFLLWLRS